MLVVASSMRFLGMLHEKSRNVSASQSVCCHHKFDASLMVHSVCNVDSFLMTQGRGQM